MTKMEKCPHCNCSVERHMTASRGWIVYCEGCGIAFGVHLPPADVFDERCIISPFKTAEIAATAWNEWVKEVFNNG